LLVWVPVDLAADGPGWPAQALLNRKGERTGDLLLQAPKSHPLLAELQWLRGFWDRLPDPEGGMTDSCRQALQDGSVKQPLARAALWTVLLRNGPRSGHLRAADLFALQAERFQSVLLYRSARLYTFDARLNYDLCWIQRSVLGEKSLNASEKAVLAQDWKTLSGSPEWPSPDTLTARPSKP
jgi:hypothetical protein